MHLITAGLTDLAPPTHEERAQENIREVVCSAVSYRVRRPLNRWLSDFGSCQLG